MGQGLALRRFDIKTQGPFQSIKGGKARLRERSGVDSRGLLDGHQHTLIGQLVGTFVARVTRVTFDPMP